MDKSVIAGLRFPLPSTVEDFTHVEVMVRHYSKGVSSPHYALRLAAVVLDEDGVVQRSYGLTGFAVQYARRTDARSNRLVAALQFTAPELVQHVAAVTERLIDPVDLARLMTGMLYDEGIRNAPTAETVED